jgi:hypothetical protein
LAAGGDSRGSLRFSFPLSLAPPPAKPLSTALIPSSSPSSLASVVPAVPSFSFLRWYCTSRSPWAWTVRALSLAVLTAVALATWKHYQAWLEKMQRWREHRKERKLLTSGDSKESMSEPSSSTAAASSSSQQPPSQSSIDASSSYHALTDLILSRYALLKQYSVALKHVKIVEPQPSAKEDGTPAATAASSSSSPSADPTKQLTQVFDELEGALAENIYLRSLLKRIRMQLKTTITPSTAGSTNATTMAKTAALAGKTVSVKLQEIK